MRIKSVSVKGLFGVFDHYIDMNLHSHITIIHGPNGFGKTILLRMIEGFFNRKFSLFHSIPFSEFKVTLDNETVVKVEKALRQREMNLGLDIEDDTSLIQIRDIDVILETGSINKRYKMIHLPLEKKRSLRVLIDDVFPELERVGEDSWLDRNRSRVLTTDDVVYLYEDRLINFLPSRYLYDGLPIWLHEIIDEVNVKLIKANRLYTSSGSFESVYVRPSKNKYIPNELTVQRYSQELAENIRNTLAEFAELSQTKDRSFPIRLMRGSDLPSEAKPEELREKLDELEQRREHLMALGLLDKEEGNVEIPLLDKNQGTLGNVLAVYVEDMEEKLAIFDDLARRLDILEEVINEKFQYKKLKIDKQNGLYFQSLDDKRIELDSLSSGEQHELVLLYQLLFQVEENSLILIDEPELSLHVAWQRRFLDDLSRITELRQFDVLIATHSPSIIGDKWDWTVELKHPEKQNVYS